MTPERAERPEQRDDATDEWGVSAQEMRDFHRNLNDNKGDNEHILSAFGSLALFFNEMDSDAFQSSGRGTDVFQRGMQLPAMQLV